MLSEEVLVRHHQHSSQRFTMKPPLTPPHSFEKKKTSITQVYNISLGIFQQKKKNNEKVKTQ